MVACSSHFLIVHVLLQELVRIMTNESSAATSCQACAAVGHTHKNLSFSFCGLAPYGCITKHALGHINASLVKNQASQMYPDLGILLVLPGTVAWSILNAATAAA